MRKFVHIFVILSFVANGLPLFQTTAYANPVQRPLAPWVPCTGYSSPIVREGVVSSNFDKDSQEKMTVVVTANHYRNFELDDYNANKCTKIGSYTLQQLEAKKAYADGELKKQITIDVAYTTVSAIIGYAIAKIPNNPFGLNPGTTPAVAASAPQVEEISNTVSKVSIPEKLAAGFEKMMSKLDPRKFRLSKLGSKGGMWIYVLATTGTTLTGKVESYFDSNGPLAARRRANATLPLEVLAGCSYQTSLPISDFISDLTQVLNSPEH